MELQCQELERERTGPVHMQEEVIWALSAGSSKAQATYCTEAGKSLVLSRYIVSRTTIRALGTGMLHQ